MKEKIENIIFMMEKDIAAAKEIFNLTPHEINEVVSGKTFRSAGEARVAVTTELVYTLNDNIPIVSTTFSNVTNLPDPDPHNRYIYIVSRLVKQAVPEREDCVCPGELVRDESGKPIGCKGFSL